MTQSQALFCVSPTDVPQLQVRAVPPPRLRRGEVLVEQLATSINPIDAKRASGYGRRLLSLRGAGRFPLVLGNDIVGIVKGLGPGVSDLRIGALVIGIAPTGRYGAHASFVAVSRDLLRPVPEGCDVLAIAPLPYSFTTAWIALQGAGLTQASAADQKVLVSGASGALGQLSLQVLRDWGARVTRSTASLA